MPLARRPAVWAALAVVGLIAVGLLIWRVVGASQSEVADLAHRVAAHGDTERGIYIVDVAAARDVLGLPEDADPFERDERVTSPGLVHDPVFRNLMIGLPHVSQPRTQDTTPTVIDHGAISAFAATGPSGKGNVVLLATTQDPEEVASVFMDSGHYQRNGDSLSLIGSAEEPIARAVYPPCLG